MLCWAELACAAPEPGRAANELGNCELHVWPGDDFHAVQFGWTHGGTVDGSMKRRNGYEPLAFDLLSTARQVERLKTLALPAMLGLEPYQAIVHGQPLTTSEIRTSTQRHAPQSPDCYAELVVDTVILQKHVLGSDSLNVLFRFRQFSGAGDQVRSLTAFVVQPIRVEALTTAETRPGSLAAALVDAFSRNVEEFGQRLKLPEKRRKRP